jgi:membrane protein required for colicin V production
MHTIDILFFIAAAFFIFIGVRRGLVGEIFRLIALIVGFFAAFLYYQEFATLMRFVPPTVAQATAFTILYIIAAVAILGIGWIIKKVIHLTPLGWVDYLFGGALGLTKTLLIFWIICLSLSAFPLSRPKLNVKGSLVFQTYKKLPPYLSLDGISKVRAALKKNGAYDVPKKIKEASQRIESLKDKVDSVKKNEFKYR